MSIATEEVRQRAIEAYRSGKGTQQQIANIFGVGLRTFARWLEQFRHAIIIALVDPDASLPIWPVVPIATLPLLEIYAVRCSRFDIPPQGMVTFSDLARAMAKEKNTSYIILCAEPKRPWIRLADKQENLPGVRNRD